MLTTVWLRRTAFAVGASAYRRGSMPKAACLGVIVADSSVDIVEPIFEETTGRHGSKPPAAAAASNCTVGKGGLLAIATDSLRKFFEVALAFHVHRAGS